MYKPRSERRRLKRASAPSHKYFCKSCGSEATKPPCVRVVDYERPLTPSKATLGTWTCSKCGKGVKVRRESLGATQKAAA